MKTKSVCLGLSLSFLFLFTALFGAAAQAEESWFQKLGKDLGKATAEALKKGKTDKGQQNQDTQPSSSSSPIEKKVAKISRRNPSIKTFDIQGVKLGMSMDEADAVLTKNGYQNPGDKVNYVKRLATSTKMVNLGYHIMQDTRKGGVVRINYTQRFSNTVAIFDKDTVLLSVVNKYGQPDKKMEISNKQGYSLMYVDYPNAPRRNKVNAACQGSMRGQGYSLVEAAKGASIAGRWSQYADREVKELCPSVVNDFNHMIKASHAPRLTVTIDAYSYVIIFGVGWGGPKEWEFRRIHQEKQDKVKAAPVVDVEF